MKPRWRKVIHDLLDNKARTILVVLSIAVGVFSIGVIAGAYQIIANDMSASYSADKPANIELRMRDFDQDVLDMIAFDDFEKNAINLLTPVQGEVMPKKRQVLLEKDVLQQLDTGVGQQLEFELPDGTIKTLTVVGIVQDTAAGAGDFLASPYGYIT